MPPIGKEFRVPVHAGYRASSAYLADPSYFQVPPIPSSLTGESTVARTIDLTRQSFTTFEEFYELVAGRCNGSTLHVTPDQAKAIYYFFATHGEEWSEPNIVPADYRVGTIQKIVVVEE